MWSPSPYWPRTGENARVQAGKLVSLRSSMMVTCDWMLMPWMTVGDAGLVVTRRVLGMPASELESDEEEDEEELMAAAAGRSRRGGIFRIVDHVIPCT